MILVIFPTEMILWFYLYVCYREFQLSHSGYSAAHTTDSRGLISQSPEALSSHSLGQVGFISIGKQGNDSSLYLRQPGCAPSCAFPPAARREHTRLSSTMPTGEDECQSSEGPFRFGRSGSLPLWKSSKCFPVHRTEAAQNCLPHSWCALGSSACCP